MLQRYYVERIDEPDHKGWLVMDRKTLRLVQFCPNRSAAQQTAREGNAEELDRALSIFLDEVEDFLENQADVGRDGGINTAMRLYQELREWRTEMLLVNEEDV